MGEYIGDIFHEEREQHNNTQRYRRTTNIKIWYAISTDQIEQKQDSNTRRYLIRYAVAWHNLGNDIININQIYNTDDLSEDLRYVFMSLPKNPAANERKF